MLVLLGVGFLAGVITAISPCVLPVLPIVFAGHATGGGRRPFAIVGGLVLSFAQKRLRGVIRLPKVVGGVVPSQAATGPELAD